MTVYRTKTRWFAHIYPFVALAVLFVARCLIIRSPGIRDKQGQQGICQRGLAGAVRTGQQGRSTGWSDAPDTLVERSLVIQLKLLQAKPI
jgi:hypothetical protein